MEEVTAGCRIRIKHVKTGRILRSSNITTESGSKDTLAYCADLAASPEDWWIVKGEHGKHLTEGSIIEYGGIIRLEHASTRKNLHCYFDAHYRAPASGEHGVCCFGDKGEGDVDDNWIIEKFVTSGTGCGRWLRSSIVRLRHQQTGRYLRSHNWTFVLANGLELQEVFVGENANDEDDKWVVDAWEPPFTPHGPSITAERQIPVHPHTRRIHPAPPGERQQIRDGARAMLLSVASMKHLSAREDGVVDARGDLNNEWETFIFRKSGEDSWQLQCAADPSRYLHVSENGHELDARGTGDASCDFVISELGKELISLRSRAFPLAFVGARENGEIKKPIETREDKYGQFWVRWV